jgi:menaquinone-dependent protoporphyrinogen oxidase
MKVLVTVASKHGATAEIGDLIALSLREAGHDVVSVAPEVVTALDPYDAVVLGSAIYAGRWLPAARDFVDRHAVPLAQRPVWVFSSGPIGHPPLPEGEPPEDAAAADRVNARGHRSFAGRLDRGQLGFMERTLTRALHAPEGDFRDWEAIRAWSAEIAESLSAKEVPA